MEDSATVNAIAAGATENPRGFNAEALKAMNDAAEGKGPSGPFANVDELSHPSKKPESLRRFQGLFAIAKRNGN